MPAVMPPPSALPSPHPTPLSPLFLAQLVSGRVPLHGGQRGWESYWPAAGFDPLTCMCRAGLFGLGRHETGLRAQAWAVVEARGLARYSPLSRSVRLVQHKVERATPGPGQGRVGRPEWTSIERVFLLLFCYYFCYYQEAQC
jgi:hypothetical protein